MEFEQRIPALFRRMQQVEVALGEVGEWQLKVTDDLRDLTGELAQVREIAEMARDLAGERDADN